jgi:TPR repeat protein
MIGVLGTIVIVIALAGFLMWPNRQKVANQTNQLVIANQATVTPNPARVTPVPRGLITNLPGVTPIPARLSTPAEVQSMDQRNAADKLNRGRQYEYGRGLPIDFEMAAELYQEAADQGNADAQNQLGTLYQMGGA